MIKIASGFEVLSNVCLDSRSLLTKAAMLGANDSLFPDYFLAQCSDDNGKLYVYKKSATPNATTGKFSPLEENLAPDVQLETLPTAGADELGKIYQYIGATDATYTKGYWYTCDGNPTDGYAWKIAFVNPPITITKVTSGTDYVEGSKETWVFKQGDTEIAKMPIDKELVVTSGNVTKITVNKVTEADPETWVYTIEGTSPAETYKKSNTEDKTDAYYKYPLVDSTYIQLGIQNQTYPIFIDAKTVVSDKLGTVEEDVTANCIVGALEIGDKITEGMNITDVVKALLIKYYAPTVSLTSTPATKIVENGSTINVDLSAVATKKSEKITDVSFYEGSTLLESVTTGVDAGGTFTHTVTTPVTATTTFKATVTDGKKTNESKVTYKFVNPFYYGVVASTAGLDVTTLTKLVEDSGDKKINYVASNEYCVFAYDSAYGDLTSALDPSSFENLSSFDKSTATVGTVTYNVYVGKSPLTSTGFEYRFKF